MAGDLNANLADPGGTPRGEAITDKRAAAGIEDMGLHFLPRRKPWLKDMCTCRMRRDGQEVRSRRYYILGIYVRLLQDMAVREPKHNSDHYMVLDCLMGRAAKELTDYLRKV